MSGDRTDLMLNMLRAIGAKLDEHDRKFDDHPYLADRIVHVANSPFAGGSRGTRSGAPV
jgi:hypothetical protein